MKSTLCKYLSTRIFIYFLNAVTKFKKYLFPFNKYLIMIFYFLECINILTIDIPNNKNGSPLFSNIKVLFLKWKNTKERRRKQNRGTLY